MWGHAFNSAGLPGGGSFSSSRLPPNVLGLWGAEAGRAGPAGTTAGPETSRARPVPGRCLAGAGQGWCGRGAWPGPGVPDRVRGRALARRGMVLTPCDGRRRSANAVQSSTNVVQSSTNVVQSSTNVVQSSTNAVQSSTKVVQSSAPLVQ